VITDVLARCPFHPPDGRGDRGVAVSRLVIASRKIEGVEPLGILLMSLVRSAPEQRRVWGTR
jgi:hypothetical protein